MSEAKAYQVGVCAPASTRRKKNKIQPSLIQPPILDIEFQQIDASSSLSDDVRKLLFRRPGQIYVLLHILESTENIELMMDEKGVFIIDRRVYRTRSIEFMEVEAIIGEKKKLVVKWINRKFRTGIINRFGRLAIVSLPTYIQTATLIPKEIPACLEN